MFHIGSGNEPDTICTMRAGGVCKRTSPNPRTHWDESHHTIPWGGNHAVRGHPYLGPVPGQDCACPQGDVHAAKADFLQRNGPQPISKEGYYKMHHIPTEHRHPINNDRAVAFWQARGAMLQRLRGGNGGN